MGKALASRWVHLSNSAAPAKPHPWPGSRWEKYLRHSAARGHTETRSVGSSFTTGCHPDGTEPFPWGDTQGCWQDRPGGNHHLVESQDFPRSLRPAAPPWAICQRMGFRLPIFLISQSSGPCLFSWFPLLSLQRHTMHLSVSPQLIELVSFSYG